MREVTSSNILTLPDGIYRKERGVYLRVSGNSRYWVLKYSMDGKRRDYALGPAKGQTITQVLAKAAKAKALILEGVDPSESRREVRNARREEALAKAVEKQKSKIPLLGDILDDAFEHVLYLRQFTGRMTEMSWAHTFREVRAGLGHRRVDLVTPDEVADYLRTDWTTHPRKSRDNLNRLLAIFDFCVLKGWRQDNPAKWKNGLDSRLPSPSLVRRLVPEEHHAALSPEELRDAVRKLWAMDDVYALCLVFGALTVGRFSEFASAKWDEIDLIENTLAVPPERRKDRKPQAHIVPLSKQALALLLRLDTSGEIVFVSPRGKALSTVQVTTRWSLVTDKPTTTHGMRSTFSDWCAQNDKNFLISEKCLMHAVGNQVFRAYQRDDLLPQRRKLLQEWADFLLPDVE